MGSNIILDDNALEKLLLFIQKEAGITFDKEKLKRLERKIVAVMQEFGFEAFSPFYHQLRFKRDAKLKEALINAITINETYFWREYEQFHILVDDILVQYLQKGLLGTLRILVAPCSSGEELYSIMIAILESKENIIEHLNIELLGIDIDSQMIQKAQKGLYSERSVQKLPKDLRERYFTKLGRMYRIDEALIKGANFKHANIFDASLESKLGHFDIIFSRNMLIYFNDNDKKKVFKQFYKLLKDDGVLFLGHADANKIEKQYFQPLHFHSHIYKKMLLK